MKRKLPVLIAIILALAISLSACSFMTQPIAQNDPAQAANIQDADQTPENDPVTPPPADDPVTPPPAVDTTDPKYISMDEAIAIALKDAGFGESDVKGLHAELERDDGVTIYDIDFFKDSKEYDYEIHAETGEILKPVKKPTSSGSSSSGSTSNSSSGSSSSGSTSNSSSSSSSTASKNITKDEAISKALSHAGLKKSQVSRLRAELDKDDGVTRYEVDFETADWEYEYEINAKTGKIIKAEKDRNDYD